MTMEVLFCDSSALLKRYVLETGTVWMNAMAHPISGNIIVVARITQVELAATISRQSRHSERIPLADASRILNEIQQDFQQQYVLVTMTDELLDGAVRLAQRHGLKGYDAVQLAAAVRIHQEANLAGYLMKLISADIEMNEAARSEGLTVDDPNDHP
jgi:uncharacterized protein